MKKFKLLFNSAFLILTAALCYSCGGESKPEPDPPDPTIYTVSCDVQGVTLDKESVEEKNTYLGKITLNEELVKEKYTLPEKTAVTVTYVRSNDEITFKWDLNNEHTEANIEINAEFITNNINITFELVEPEADESITKFICSNISANDVITFGVKGELISVNWGDGSEADTETSHIYLEDHESITISVIGKVSSIYLSSEGGAPLSESNTKINKITLGEGVTSLPKKAFVDINLSKIDIPDTVNIIGSEAFSNSNPESTNMLFLCCKAEEKPSAWAEDWNGLDKKHSYTYWGYIDTYKGGWPYFVYDICTDGAYVEGIDYTTSYSFNIPETVTYKDKDYSVKAISPYAFMGRSNIQGVTFPKSIEKIGYAAFKDMPKMLFNPSFPDDSNLTLIDDEAFANCTKISEIIIPESVVTMGHNVFRGSGVNTFYIKCAEDEEHLDWAEDWFGDRVDAVKWWGFIEKGTTSDGLFDYISTKHGAYITAYYDQGANEVTVPDAVGNKTTEVKYIQGYLFKGNTNITSVHLPDTVVTIGDYAFGQCSNLEDINMPRDLVSIGANAFYLCASLTSKFIFPSNLKSIGSAAFEGCTSLDEYVLPEGLEIIGSDALKIKSGKIKAVVIPESVSTIGTSAVSGEAGLNIYCRIEEKPSGWADYWVTDWTIKYCYVYWGYIEEDEDIDTGYSYVKTKHGLYITNYVGEEPTGELIIPDTIDGIDIVSVGDNVFSGNTNITSVKLPKTLTNIGKHTFDNCTNLQSIEIPSTLENIGDYAFSGCASLESIDLPSTLTYICEGAFNGCSNLIIVNLASPSSLVSIGDYAFNGCSKIEGEFVFPSSLVSIGVSAFSNCGNIHVVIPKSVTTIKNYAFSRVAGVVCCEVKEKPEGWMDSWAKATSGDPVRVYWDATTFDQEGDFKFVANKTEAQIYDYDTTSTNTDVVIPSTLKGKTVVNIGKKSFFQGTFTSIRIPNTVKSIEDIAFFNCHNLREIYIPSSVEKMGIDLFDATFGDGKLEHAYCEPSSKPDGWLDGWIASSCPVTWGVERKQSSDFEYIVSEGEAHIMRYTGSDKNVEIPSKLDNIPVTSLGAVFTNNRTIETVTLPNTITKIECGTFSGCTNLTTINLTSYGDEDTLPTAADGVFSDTVKFEVSSTTIRDNLIALGGGWPTDEERYIFPQP